MGLVPKIRVRSHDAFGSGPKRPNAFEARSLIIGSGPKCVMGPDPYFGTGPKCIMGQFFGSSPLYKYFGILLPWGNMMYDFVPN